MTEHGTRINRVCRSEVGHFQGGSWVRVEQVDDLIQNTGRKCFAGSALYIQPLGVLTVRGIGKTGFVGTTLIRCS